MKTRILLSLFVLFSLASCAVENTNMKPTMSTTEVDYYRVVGMKNGQPNGATRIISVPRNPVKK